MALQDLVKPSRAAPQGTDSHERLADTCEYKLLVLTDDLFFDFNSVTAIECAWRKLGLNLNPSTGSFTEAPGTGGPAAEQPDGATLIQFDQFSLDEFQRQNLVYLKGIVSLAIDMSFEHLFHRIRTKVGSAARVRVKKHLP